MITTASPAGDLPYNELIEVAPAQAAAWLDQNENNRPINWNYVAQLARDMKAGRFACTHQGIAFDTSGRLIDGQHRLWAIVDADVPVRVRVFRNEPPENIVHIDGNCPRRAADRMTLGRSLGTVRADELATLRAMLGGISMAYRRRTLQEEMDLLEQHREAIHSTYELLPGRRPAGIANCMVRSVLARAWYCMTDDMLLGRFCEVLRTGVSGPERERPIVLLRNQLLDLRRQPTTREVRQRQYALTSRALVAYLDEEPLTLLRAPATELFVMPGEAGQEAA